MIPSLAQCGGLGAVVIDAEGMPFRTAGGFSPSVARNPLPNIFSPRRPATPVFVPMTPRRPATPGAGGSPYFGGYQRHKRSGGFVGPGLGALGGRGGSGRETPPPVPAPAPVRAPKPQTPRANTTRGRADRARLQANGYSATEATKIVSSSREQIALSMTPDVFFVQYPEYKGASRLAPTPRLTAENLKAAGYTEFQASEILSVWAKTALDRKEPFRLGPVAFFAKYPNVRKVPGAAPGRVAPNVPVVAPALPPTAQPPVSAPSGAGAGVVAPFTPPPSGSTVDSIRRAMPGWSIRRLVSVGLLRSNAGTIVVGDGKAQFWTEGERADAGSKGMTADQYFAAGFGGDAAFPWSPVKGRESKTDPRVLAEYGYGVPQNAAGGALAPISSVAPGSIIDPGSGYPGWFDPFGSGGALLAPPPGIVPGLAPIMQFAPSAPESAPGAGEQGAAFKVNPVILLGLGVAALLIARKRGRR